MKKWWLFSAVLLQICGLHASWYWPFGDDEDEKIRLSVLMRDATRLIDDATEMAATNNVRGAVEKYRESLQELAKVEAENPERAKTVEFTSLRNKRAYVTAAIDSLLLNEARSNAKAVAITDTTELEKRFIERRTGKRPDEAKPKAASKKTAKKASVKAEKPVKKASKPKAPLTERLVAALKKDPDNRKLRLALIGEYIRVEKYDLAKPEIETLLKKNMSDSSALNLKAVCEASQGNLKEAEDALFLSIKSNPHDFNGYYNMANLKLEQLGNRDAAKLYYETGRKMGGPRDGKLEEAFK